MEMGQKGVNTDQLETNTICRRTDARLTISSLKSYKYSAILISQNNLKSNDVADRGVPAGDQIESKSQLPHE